MTEAWRRIVRGKMASQGLEVNLPGSFGGHFAGLTGALHPLPPMLWLETLLDRYMYMDR